MKITILNETEKHSTTNKEQATLESALGQTDKRLKK